MKMGDIVWTLEEEDLIEKYYLIKSDKEISEMLDNKTEAQVRSKRMKLGLKKQRQTFHKKKIEGMKWCWYCNEYHELDAFNNNKNKADGKQDECRVATKYLIAKRKANKTKKSLNIKDKMCSSCGINKKIENFIKNVSTSDGYSNLCIDCLNKNEINRKYKNVEEKKNVR